MAIYTDGSCLKNPGGAGGWCFCLIENDKEYIVCGSEPETTNNRMELTAVIEALKVIKNNVEYIIYTDSQLVLNCAIGKWKRKANIDLWNIYDKVSKNKKLNWKWIKAHNGNKYNELVDKIAYNEAKNLI
jgi:ribonuclease HI